jgi:hypothetical protein
VQVFQCLAVGHVDVAQRRTALDTISHNSVESGLAEPESFFNRPVISGYVH